MRTSTLTAACAAILLLGSTAVAGAQQAPAADAAPFHLHEAGKFNEPWAMTFLPDGRLLVTEKRGALKLVELGAEPSANKAVDVGGLPEVAYGGQGGLGDVVLHPQYAGNGLVYISYAEAGEGDLRGAAVARARLDLEAGGGASLQDVQVIWRQAPKVTGRGHYGHRIAFDEAGMLWISSGDRQKLDPAQDMQSNLGKIVRLNDDGSVPDDNPFSSQDGVAREVWSLGHRNPLGIAFDAQGRLWAQEMGPRHGDELNLIERGANYGWPVVSNGEHYDGRDIPDHDTRPEFAAPRITWTPVISPGGLVFYDGQAFPAWKGNAFIGGLSSKALVRIEIDGDQAREAARYAMDNRIREVEQGPEGHLWLLEDERDGSGGRLLRLDPKS